MRLFSCSIILLAASNGSLSTAEPVVDSADTFADTSISSQARKHRMEIYIVKASPTLSLTVTSNGHDHNEFGLDEHGRQRELAEAGIDDSERTRGGQLLNNDDQLSDHGTVRPSVDVVDASYSQTYSNKSNGNSKSTIKGSTYSKGWGSSPDDSTRYSVKRSKSSKSSSKRSKDSKYDNSLAGSTYSEKSNKSSKSSSSQSSDWKPWDGSPDDVDADDDGTSYSENGGEKSSKLPIKGSTDSNVWEYPNGDENTSHSEKGSKSSKSSSKSSKSSSKGSKSSSKGSKGSKSSSSPSSSSSSLKVSKSTESSYSKSNHDPQQSSTKASSQNSLVETIDTTQAYEPMTIGTIRIKPRTTPEPLDGHKRD